MDKIEELIRAETDGGAECFQLIRAKAGVHVYRCLYEGKRAVAKCFENEGDRREIGYYRLLAEMHVLTMRVFRLGQSCIVMEDIDASDAWRLGEEKDMEDPDVLRALADWYFALHEAGGECGRLKEMDSENDALHLGAIETIRKRLPGAEALCDFTRDHLSDLRILLRERENTIAYNDFYYTNFLVRRDKSAAMMFDYNCMGRGYRYADFRNVQSSVSQAAFEAFMEEYAALYSSKYGREYAADEAEKRLDDFISPLLGLANALERDELPAWAESMMEDAVNGVLLAKGRRIFLLPQA